MWKVFWQWHCKNITARNYKNSRTSVNDKKKKKNEEKRENRIFLLFGKNIKKRIKLNKQRKERQRLKKEH